MNPCPLCANTQPKQTVPARVARRYFLCPECRLIFLDPAHFLPLNEEQQFYDTHENSIDDPGYVGFLQRLLTPAMTFLRPGMQGLDFGCGPGPTLSKLLAREGIACDDFDPLFFPNPLQAQYDFILSSECFEHLRRPAAEISALLARLVPGGYLGIMTDRWQSEAQFYDWHYTRDPTHCSFFHRATLDWLCETFALSLCFVDERRIAIFQKN
ncbi:class I SAM-dependent methyltransferase [Shewanella algae]|uniref:class I SAM-dependent methyltransferase n=1 Tax=Shewanella algae TaxID=38313 RepID=UPI0031F5BE35